jgi:mannose-6-phosphate isomerase-like protein (cupin superfamily)
MKLFRLDSDVGKSIDAFGSMGFVISKIVRLSAQTDVKIAYLGANSVVGYHQTTRDQVFAVVHGEGWVRGESPERFPIEAGQAAFWAEGEWHESGSETGMTVILIEGENIDPTKTMPPL